MGYKRSHRFEQARRKDGDWILAKWKEKPSLTFIVESARAEGSLRRQLPLRPPRPPPIEVHTLEDRKAVSLGVDRHQIRGAPAKSSARCTTRAGHRASPI
jgi:hypothetical protein